MWDFCRPVLQTISGAVCLAVIWWVHAYAKSQYKARKPLIDRIIAFIAVDASTAAGIVVTGLQVAKFAKGGNSGQLLVQWFVLLMLTLTRLYAAHMHNAALRIIRMREYRKKAEEEFQTREQAPDNEQTSESPFVKWMGGTNKWMNVTAKWMSRTDESILDLNKPILNPLVLYEIASTAAWFWLALYFVIFWR